MELNFFPFHITSRFCLHLLAVWSSLFSSCLAIFYLPTCLPPQSLVIVPSACYSSRMDERANDHLVFNFLASYFVPYFSCIRADTPPRYQSCHVTASEYVCLFVWNVEKIYHLALLLFFFLLIIYKATVITERHSEVGIGCWIIQINSTYYTCRLYNWWV